ncbi:calponin homology domain-containing protein [Pyronema omphalodes]|nr:calponin homology domain-containing protein [Pyronema omphalodes]
MNNIITLSRRYPQFKQEEIFELQSAFNRLADGNDSIDKQTAMQAAVDRKRVHFDQARKTLLNEVRLDSSGTVGFEEFVEFFSKLEVADPKSPTGRVKGHGRSDSNTYTAGAGATSVHTVEEYERTEFTRHINAVLDGDSDIGDRLPLPTDTAQIFEECKDGLLLAKLINDSVPDTIDERVLNRTSARLKKLNQFQMTENNNIVINSAKAIGCSVVNVGSGDIIAGSDHLILGLIWQIIRRGLLSKIDIKLHPELYRLLEDGETLEQFLRLSPEKILLRWFNFHLKAAKWHRTVTNFAADLKDSENYTVLLNQLKPDICSRKPLQTGDLLQRAEEVLQNADKIGCRKFLTPRAIIDGSAGSARLNFAFIANLFNTHPGLDALTEDEQVEIEDFDAEGEREARVFTLWLNSLGVEPSVNDFFHDLQDGTLLLQAFNKVIPGSVNMRFVNQRRKTEDDEPMMRFKAVENTNYAVEIGKQHRFSLVGIQGADITDGQRTLTLALAWQLMRRDISRTLDSLAKKVGMQEVTDQYMLKWANEMAKKGGKNTSIKSFKDQSLGTGVFLLDVLNGMKSGYVDYALVNDGRTEEDAYLNAKLSISIARKMGATIWLVPEDIVAVRSRLIVTFLGSLMAASENM